MSTAASGTGLAPDLLAGKVVLVTGAGRGVGRGIALACGEAGATVVATGPGDNVDETAAMVEKTGATVAVARTDVTVRSEVEAAVALAVARFGGLDAMVHNATSRRSSEVHAMEAIGGPMWDDHMAVSVRGAYYCAMAALTELRRRHGCLVLMTSPAGMEGSQELPGYGAVKAALRGMTKALAIEWGPLGVRVVAVSPLAVTPALDNAYKENPSLEARLKEVVPLGRVGDPRTDVAPAVAWLCSDAARYVSGQTLCVDGGRFTGL